MAEGPNDWEWQVGLATHEWKAAENPGYSLALAAEGRGETSVRRSPRAEPLAAKPAPESPAADGTTDGGGVRPRESRSSVETRPKEQGQSWRGWDDHRRRKDYLREHWPTIRSQLLGGTYQPQPVKRVEIPKPDGGVRKLGVPCVVDRLIQQAVAAGSAEAVGPDVFRAQLRIPTGTLGPSSGGPSATHTLPRATTSWSIWTSKNFSIGSTMTC